MVVQLGDRVRGEAALLALEPVDVASLRVCRQSHLLDVLAAPRAQFLSRQVLRAPPPWVLLPEVPLVGLPVVKLQVARHPRVAACLPQPAGVYPVHIPAVDFHVGDGLATDVAHGDRGVAVVEQGQDLVLLVEVAPVRLAGVCDEAAAATAPVPRLFLALVARSPLPLCRRRRRRRRGSACLLCPASAKVGNLEDRGSSLNCM